MKDIDVHDLVRIVNVKVDAEEADPNGFVGIVKSATLILDTTETFDSGEVVYDVELPIQWAPGKNEWTFRNSDLEFIESL